MRGWKAGLRTAACGAYRFSGGMWLHESLARAAGQQFMTILLFHRVTDAIPEDGLTVSTARFRSICHLLATRFHVVPLGEVFRLQRSGDRLPRRTLAITFDDCYRDNLAAARVMHEFGLPATFFVPTAYVNSDRVFPWDRHLPAMPNLTWDELREMTRLGFEVGSHTVNHANLGTATLDAARHELSASRDLLQAKLDLPTRWFAYPFGGQQHLRPEYLPLIAEAGYEGALSAYGGFVTPKSDARVLPREAVPYFKSLPHLEMHLSGCLHWLYALRGRHNGEQAGDPWAFSEREPTEARHELRAPADR